MKLIIDIGSQILTVVEGDSSRDHPLYSKTSFEAISRQWLRVGWSLGYYMNFSWLGLPVVQIPEDLIRLKRARSKPWENTQPKNGSQQANGLRGEQRGLGS